MTKANSVFSLILCISNNTGSSKMNKVSKNADFISLVAESLKYHGKKK
jgi:hypothetical protein